MLEREPPLASKVWFLAVMTRARAWLPEYVQYLERCLQLAQEINDRYSSYAGGREVVTIDLEDNPQRSDYPRAIGSMIAADVMLINPLVDGLNLVAKEAVAASDPAPIIILSENAGVYTELADAVLAINPFDTVATADALRQSIGLEAAGRRRRSEQLRNKIEARTPEMWLDDRLHALGVDGSDLHATRRT
jgi:trehalose 6-phosphate synthase